MDGEGKDARFPSSLVVLGLESRDFPRRWGRGKSHKAAASRALSGFVNINSG